MVAVHTTTFPRIMYPSSDSYQYPPCWSFGCLGCVGGGGLERPAEICKRTSLGEVVAAGVATVESRRFSSRTF